MKQCPGQALDLMLSFIIFTPSIQTKDELLEEKIHEPEWKIDQQKRFRQTVEESGLPVRHYAVADEGTEFIRKVRHTHLNDYEVLIFRLGQLKFSYFKSMYVVGTNKLLTCKLPVL